MKIKKMFDEFIKLSKIEALDDLVDNDKILITNFESANIFDDILKTLKDAKINSNEYDNLLKDLKSQYSNAVFFDKVDEIIEDSIEAYNDSKFLREMEYEDAKFLIREIFDNRILIYEDLNYLIKQLKDKFSSEQILITENIIEFCIMLILYKRYSFNLFTNNISNKFSLDEKICEYIWDMITRNKDELFKRYIIDKLEELTSK